MRAIIRFSVDGEKNGALRNKLRKVLTDAVFLEKHNTATYERSGKRLTESVIANSLASFWKEAKGHKGPGKLDHFWMYAEQEKKTTARNRQDKKTV